MPVQKRENGDANAEKLKWARWFLERGFAVFPVDPETKKAVLTSSPLARFVVRQTFHFAYFLKYGLQI